MNRLVTGIIIGLARLHFAAEFTPRVAPLPRKLGLDLIDG